MKISMFIGGLSGGGAERVTCNVASYLAQKGHDVIIMTMADDEASYEIDNRVKRVVLLHDHERKGVLYNNITRYIRLRDYLMKNAIDIYVVMLPITTILLLAMRKIIKGKIIASERIDPSTNPRWQKLLLKRLAKNADGWLFQTEEERKWYGEDTRNAIVSIIPNAINNDFIKPAYSGERRKVIVTAGRMTEQKNHLLLIKAFAKISLKNSDYKLTIYGEGSLMKKILLTVKELGLESRVVLPGYTTDIGDKIKDASLFVLSSDFEGMPNALMEAMALGVPCVSTDCDGGGANFLIDNEKNGLLVPKGDVDALAAAMDRMLSDREFAEQCGKEAHKICERLAPEKIYREWENFIKEIVNS